MTIGEQAGNGQPDFSALAENDLAGLVQDLVEWLGTGKRGEFAFEHHPFSSWLVNPILMLEGPDKLGR